MHKPGKGSGNLPQYLLKSSDSRTEGCIIDNSLTSMVENYECNISDDALKA